MAVPRNVQSILASGNLEGHLTLGDEGDRCECGTRVAGGGRCGSCASVALTTRTNGWAGSRDWVDAANCRGVDANTMQPETATPDELEQAMRFCVGCPVADMCADLAESQAGAYGIHGGMWWGDPPANPEAVPCQWCGTGVASVRGTRAYCGQACQKAAWRARLAVSA